VFDHAVRRSLQTMTSTGLKHVNFDRNAEQMRMSQGKETGCSSIQSGAFCPYWNAA
jgi:hypothetical protein